MIDEGPRISCLGYQNIFFGTRTRHNTCPKCGHNSTSATLDYGGYCYNPACDYDEFNDEYDNYRWRGFKWVEFTIDQMELF